MVSNTQSGVRGAQRRGARRRVAAALFAGALATTGLLVVTGGGAQGGPDPQPVPRADCGKGARPETDIQGRVPTSDYTSGRVDRGYRCNTRPVARHGESGGFKVLRYKDAKGQTCAFYDSTLLFPRDVLYNAGSGLGVVVLAMDNPRKPRQTATLTTPAMLSPHESLLLNKKRGLLAATLGTAATYPGVLDIYDIRTDCRHPRLFSSTPSGLLGHESGWAPDGRTFWTASTTGSLVAVDVMNPRAPKPVMVQPGVQYHGLRFSADGDTMYATNIGSPDLGGLDLAKNTGLDILDVSKVHDRVIGAMPTVLSKLTWPEASIPQSAEPFTQKGHDYVLEMDEYADVFSVKGFTDMGNAPVGAGRIINVDNPRKPFVVSRLRLEVHQPEVHGGEQATDPGASSPAQGYAGHYCSVPKRNNPRIAGCSMIVSGLRLFDISNVRKPREVAYFNKPVRPGSKPSIPNAEGAYAMSAPAWDRKRGSVWYTDANSGFYNIKLTNGVARLLRNK
ncbi:hypothetical protein [Nocardioides piscis]|uniref:Uncharacterized protein n=1 Tax=Nocardioides piscis TaxID=2714938 RepID=A0A6G7YIU4_9ACTN|nr:hypothetical protein [Nocardioides piscis]QIK76656.1 hypothetical protein G7071_15710 [Nocardioides piscis]